MSPLEKGIWTERRGSGEGRLFSTFSSSLCHKHFILHSSGIAAHAQLL
jgi:hypothetical protein